jgi:endonuclease/exonuclease/phosphatase family metal-dependent hydrolase
LTWVSLRVVTWNLKHGRSVPGAGRDLFDDFSEALAGWEWDLALLQEVPPWWPAALGERLHAASARVLTSRNAALPLRRAIAVRWPDAIKSNGGGCNATLVRRGAAIAERRALRLSLLPERRRLLAVRLDSAHDPPLWVGNLHANGRPAGAAARESRLAAETMLAWAGRRAPIVLGGDFNLRSAALDGYAQAAAHDVDFVFVRGLDIAASPATLERGPLSDHAPLSIALKPVARPVP